MHIQINPKFFASDKGMLFLGEEICSFHKITKDKTFKCDSNVNLGLKHKNFQINQCKINSKQRKDPKRRSYR